MITPAPNQPVPSTLLINDYPARRMTLTDNSVSSTRAKSSSPPPPPAATDISASNKLSICFETGSQMILRPNRILRGTVKLKVKKPILASQIRIKFRAEEAAKAKVKEHGLETKIERVDQVVTTYFQVDTKVWGTEASGFSISPWEELDVGEYEYPFALKFPNVNFPPSIDDPVGFSIHYIWSAHLDGPCHSPGLRSKDYVMPYRPIICAPAAKEWSCNQTIYHCDKKSPIANVKATLPRFAFCPDEDVDMELQVDSIPENLIVSGIQFSLNKFVSGQIQLQRGLARKHTQKKILSGTLAVGGNAGSVKLPVHFHIPTRLVSPSFQSRHIRVFYELEFTIQFTHSGLLKTSSSTSECKVPIGITNLPHHHLLHIPNLTSVQSYMESKEAPVFFDPSLDEPPNQSSIPSELWGPLTAALTTPPATSPPNYFSLSTLPSQFIKRDREERTVFTSELVKPGMATELGDPIPILYEHKDYDW